MTLEQLRALIASGEFHHATMRIGRGRCWDGLYIYRKDANGFNGFALVDSFGYWTAGSVEHKTQDEAYALVKNTGVSMGAYGQG